LATAIIRTEIDVLCVEKRFALRASVGKYCISEEDSNCHDNKPHDIKNIHVI